MIDFYRYHIGDKIYFAGYDSNFPEESMVSEYEILDASEKGMVNIVDDYWIDPNNPEEYMFPTKQLAEESLKKQIRERRRNGKES
ncbi:MAG: hypothetical protein K6G83_02030 [Lachnospiraceae bacterium]|nr:hypothetical protein [Lachnospiraceae bacterium]